MNRLIVYTDGSYRDNRAGWGFLYFFDNNPVQFFEACGSCWAKDCVHGEMIAVLKAVSHLSCSPYEKIDELEIRLDLKSLIHYIRLYKDLDFKHSDLEVNFVRKYYDTFYELLYILEQLPYPTKVKKVTDKDQWLKRTHINARYALDNIDTTIDISFFRQIDQDTFTPIPDNNEYLAPLSPIIPNNTGEKKWYQNDINTIINIPVDDIYIDKKIHLKTRNITFTPNLGYYHKIGKIELPIAVRAIDDNRFFLLCGISRLCIAKLLNFRTIPAIIYNMDRKEFASVHNLQR